MPFFADINQNIKKINIKGDGNLFKLKSKHKTLRKLILNPNELKETQKKVSFITSEKLDASLTVEASIAFPIFLGAVYLFIVLIQLFTLQSKLEYALHETAKEMALYGYLYDEIIDDAVESSRVLDEASSLLLGSTYVKNRVIERVGEEYLERSSVKNGSNGLYFYLSSIMEEEEYIDLVVMYRIKPKFQLLPIVELRMINRCKIKAFTGYEGIKDESLQLEEMVYVTEYGEVYHRSLGCSYLQMDKVYTVAGSEESILYNGKAYQACSYCCQEEEEDSGYVTLYGGCYHASPYCSRIYREIFEIPISEVGDRRSCSKCY